MKPIGFWASKHEVPEFILNGMLTMKRALGEWELYSEPEVTEEEFLEVAVSFGNIKLG